MRLPAMSRYVFYVCKLLSDQRLRRSETRACQSPETRFEMESPGVILPPESQANDGRQDAGGQQSLMNPELVAWVETVARLMDPQIVHWCTGTEDEAERIFELMLRDGSVEKLDSLLHPNSYYVRGDVEDAERSSDRTFICSLN